MRWRRKCSFNSKCLCPQLEIKHAALIAHVLPKIITFDSILMQSFHSAVKGKGHFTLSEARPNNHVQHMVS